MNIPAKLSLHPTSRIAILSGYIRGFFQRSAKAIPLAVSLPTTRRQALLMAQDLKRNEQRIRMLELLHEIRR